MQLPLSRAKTELVEAVRITDPIRHLTSSDLAGVTVAIWAEHRARRALDLIADLPPDELYRCFAPGWGIRAHSATEELFEIAFCFRCHSARLWGPDVLPEHRGQTFDAQSPAARELLRLFRSCVQDGSGG
ncbi:hypothetical protein [Streptomyces sp. NPDC006879]|uniref:hypothetical protein n=1 Tax=Streptomyces sp. NPDC006879 TaxID=3364767 RepID=UPI003694A272